MLHCCNVGKCCHLKTKYQCCLTCPTTHLSRGFVSRPLYRMKNKIKRKKFVEKNKAKNLPDLKLTKGGKDRLR